MIDLMREAKDAGHRMGMLTNNVREWEPLWRSMLPVDEIFEVVVDSGFVGCRKPEPRDLRDDLRAARASPRRSASSSTTSTSTAPPPASSACQRSTTSTTTRRSPRSGRRSASDSRLIVAAVAVPHVELGRLSAELHHAGRREPLQHEVQGALLGDPLLEGLLSPEAGGELEGLAAVDRRASRTLPSGSPGWAAAGRPPSIHARRRASRCRARRARRSPWRSAPGAPRRESRRPRREPPRRGAGGGPPGPRSRQSP